MAVRSTGKNAILSGSVAVSTTDFESIVLLKPRYRFGTLEDAAGFGSPILKDWTIPGDFRFIQPGSCPQPPVLLPGFPG